MTDGLPLITREDAVLAAVREIFPAHLHERILLTGGTVRDLLLGKTGEDVDLTAAVAAAELLPLGFRHVTPVSAAPILFRFHPTLGKVEITLVEPTAPLEADLRRRDFTVNAMALTLDGRLHDPLNGRQALTERVLAVCSERAFQDDPMRIFRAFRFEAAGWRLAASAEALIRESDWDGPLRAMPAERFSGEMLKAMAGTDPGRFFRRMLEFGVGSSFVPELFRMAAVPAGPLTHHPEGDLFSHSLETLDRAARLSSDVPVRLGAFFHDLGKLATATECYPRHHGHDRAGAAIAEELCDRLRLSAALRRALVWTCRLHLVAARWPELRDGTKMRVAEEARKAGVAAFLPLIVAADKGRAGGMEGWELAVTVAGLSGAELGIDPRLLAGGDEEVQTLPPERRAAFIRERRVAEFRRRLRG